MNVEGFFLKTPIKWGFEALQDPSRSFKIIQDLEGILKDRIKVQDWTPPPLCYQAREVSALQMEKAPQRLSGRDLPGLI